MVSPPPFSFPFSLSFSRGTVLKLVKAYGVTADGKMRLSFILDEDQQNVTTAQVNWSRREVALHSYSYREELLEPFREALLAKMDKDEVDELLATIDQPAGPDNPDSADRPQRVAWSIPELATYMVGVTATLAPRVMVLGQEVSITSLVPADSYFGYASSLSENRTIKMVSTESLEADAAEDIITGDITKTHPLNAFPHIRSVSKTVLARPGFEHLILFCSTSRNEHLMDIGKWVLRNAVKDDDLAFACLSIGGSALSNYGSIVLGNDTPRARAVMARMGEADKLLHKMREPGTQTAIGGMHNGQRVLHSGGLLETKGSIAVDDPTVLPEVAFVKSACYRIRTVLDVLQKALQLEGVDASRVKIITIGNALLREGVTIKTSDHNLGPTAMVLAFKSLLDHVRLIQVWIVKCLPEEKKSEGWGAMK
jgi:hypothetical protein